jgi:hypothetical protein
MRPSSVVDAENLKQTLQSGSDGPAAGKPRVASTCLENSRRQVRRTKSIDTGTPSSSKRSRSLFSTQ